MKRWKNYIKKYFFCKNATKKYFYYNYSEKKTNLHFVGKFSWKKLLLDATLWRNFKKSKILHRQPRWKDENYNDMQDEKMKRWNDEKMKFNQPVDRWKDEKMKFQDEKMKFNYPVDGFQDEKMKCYEKKRWRRLSSNPGWEASLKSLKLGWEIRIFKTPLLRAWIAMTSPQITVYFVCLMYSDP